MPNYDLGTARARIRVDSDTRGADAADRSLGRFQRTIRGLAGRMSSFEASMNRMESELRDVSQEFRRAEREADSLDREMDKVRQTFERTRVGSGHLGDEIQELSSRMKVLYHTASTVIPPMFALTRFARDFRNSRGGMFGFFGAFARAGGAAAAVGLLTSRFTGLGAALAGVTGWQRDVVRFAGAFRTLTYAATTVAGLAARFGLLSKAAGKAVDLLAPMDYAFRGLTPRVMRFSRAARDAGFSLDRFAGGAIQAIGGIALMRSGFQGLANRFNLFGRSLAYYSRMFPGITAAIASAIGSIPALIEASGKVLIWFSNILAGALDGVKQLAGGFLALPGAISMAVASIGTLKAIMSGLETLFEDIFDAENVEELAEAINALPPEFKEIGKELAVVSEKLKDLQKQLVGTFMSGSLEQIRLLSETYFPVMGKATSQVANSWRIAKDNLVAFASQAQTISDVQLIFQQTSATMNQLSSAIQPAASGLRDIAAVGAVFLRQLSAGLPGLTREFAEWARVNRENGNLMRWMDEAWRGVKDLTKGLRDAVKATWTLLTLFTDRSPENALERFADAMARFNDAVQRSADSGFLREFADGVRNLGTEKLEQMKDVLSSLWDAMQEIIPTVRQASEAFGRVFVPALKLSMEIVEQLFHVFEELGGAQVMGTILGLVAGFQLLKTVAGPLRNIFQIALGAVTGFKGAQNLILGAAGALENLGPVGKRASDALLGAGDNISRFVGRLAGVAAIVGGIVLAVNRHNDMIAENARVTADSTRIQKEFGEELRNAFLADRGLAGNTVFDTVTRSVSDMTANLREQAAQMPSLMEHVTSWFATAAGTRDNEGFQWHPFQDSGALNDIQDAAAEAQKTIDVFDRLGLTNQELAQIISGSQTTFDNQVRAIRESGDGGGEAAAALARMRSEFERTRQEWEAAGPGAALLAEGIQEIADAGGDAQTKLSGLRTALEGLGLIQTSYYEAAASYATAIEELGDAALNAADKTQPFNDILDAQGRLNVEASANARNLLNVLTPISDEFLRLAANGGNVNDAWAQMQPELASVAEAFQLTVPQVQALIQQLGVVPTEVGILVGLEGQDQVTKDLAQVILQARQWAENGTGGTGIPIPVEDPAELERRIEQIFGDIADSTDTAIKFKFDVDPQALDFLTAMLNDKLNATTEDGQQRGQEFSEGYGTGIQEGQPATDGAVDTILDSIQGKTDQAEQNALDGGRSFSENFAQGILDGLGDISSAADQAAQEAADRMPGSPAKKGPLSGRGWSRYAGEAFSGDFASGMVAGTDSVGRAANTVAGAAAGAYQQRPFLGQLTDLLNLASGFKDVFSRIADAVIGFTKFLSDPLGEGTFFGKSTGSAFGFKRDPSVSDDDLRRAREDKLQSRWQSAQSGGSRRRRSGSGEVDLSALGDNPTKEQIAGAISAEAERRGYDQSTAIASVAAAMLESSLNPNITNATGHHGLFQQSSDKPLRANAAEQITWFFNEMDRLGGPSAVASDPMSFIADNIEKGGYPGTDYIQFIGEAKKLIDAFNNRDDSLKFGDRATGRSGGVTVTGEQGLQPAAASLLDRVLSEFPEIRNVGGVRPDSMPYHPSGRALDIMIPNYNTPEGKALGDEINQWLQANADKIGLEDTIWQDFWQGTSGSGRKLGRSGATQGHYDHIHATLIDGVSSAIDEALSPSEIRTHGRGSALGPDLSGFTPEELAQIQNSTAFSAKTQDEMLSEMRGQNAQLDSAITAGRDPNSTEAQIASSLSTIQTEIDRQSTNDTPAGRQQLQALEGIKNEIMTDQGFTEGANPIDQASTIASGAASIAGDIFNVLNKGIEAVGATKNLVDMAIRYPSNTEDIMTMIDDIQKYIEFGAAVAGAVSSSLNMIGSVAGAGGGADPTGGASAAAAAIQGASQIAALVQAALETTNAVIDLAQEAWHIFGSYFGDFLGFLTGGMSQLEGNVRFLLDQNTGQLLAYSEMNPQDKRAHNVPGMLDREAARSQGIGQINMYGGPGSDPRDMTRDMMFEVRASKFAGATQR